MSEGAPVSNTSSFPTTSEPTIPPAKKSPDIFAGCRVFDVNTDEYQKLLRGSKKWDRWNKYFENSGENEKCHEIRKYLYRNPAKTLVLRNITTNDMVYFKPRGKAEL